MNHIGVLIGRVQAPLEIIRNDIYFGCFISTFIYQSHGTYLNENKMAVNPYIPPCVTKQINRSMRRIILIENTGKTGKERACRKISKQQDDEGVEAAGRVGRVCCVQAVLMSAASTPPKSLSHLIAPEEDDPWKPGFVPPEVAADSNVYSCNCCGLLGTSHGLHGTALMLRCTGCRAARYCSATCQNEDWAVGGHRAICLETRSRRENLLEGDDRSMFLTPRRLQRQDNSSSTDNDKDTAEQAAIFVRRISTGDKNVVVKKDGKARIVTPQPSIKPNALNLNHGGS